MKKDTLIQIILGTIGGLVASIGMCMCLIPEWNLFVPGVVVSIIGVIILLCMIPIYRKEHPSKGGAIVPFFIGIVGALLMGFGMSKIMIDNVTQSNMIIGIIIGVIGLLICVLNYPVNAYLKNNKN